MTYFRFHCLFNLPLLLVLGFFNASIPWHHAEVMVIIAVLAAVMIFTTPWDNCAAKWGIWGFTDGKYSFKIGYLPLEEYLFFILQSMNVMLAERLLVAHVPAFQTGLATAITIAQIVLLIVLALAWIGLGIYWLKNPVQRRYHYMYHLLFWFLPVVAGQWILAGVLFCAQTGLLVLLTLIFGSYYTATDIVAVRAGTWFIDGQQTTGAKFALVLPWEEAAFFYLTSLLVAQSYLLLLPANLR